MSRRIRRLLSRAMSRALAGLGLLLVFVAIFQLVLRGPMTGAIAVIACLLSTAVAAGCLRAARRQRAMIILAYCEQGARLHAPLPDFLRAVAANESPLTAQRLIAIAITLEAPASLGSAIASELPELPLRFGELLRAAESSGTLVATLTRILREDEPENVDGSVHGSMAGAYLAITLLALAFPANLILFFVMPKMAAIFRDFGLKLPWTWSVPFALGPNGYEVLMAGMIFLTIVILILVLTRHAEGIFFRRREYDRPFRHISDRIRWHLPIVGAGIRDRDWADVCQSIADGLEQHRPIEVMLGEAVATQHLNDVTATRVDRWRIEVTRGEPLAKAARDAHVPRVISGLIGESALASDALAPVFSFLARHYRAKSVQRGAWLSAAAMPALTLACGALVVAFALFLWIPMTHLIDAVIPYPMGL